MRGVQVGVEGDDSSLGRAGPLELVAIRWLEVSRLLGGSGQTREPSPDLSSDAIAEQGDREKRKGLWIEIRYENAICTALLIPMLSRPREEIAVPSWIGFGDATSATDSENFLHLPLLLLRMPIPLKAFIIDFLSSTFDCRVSPLRLGTKSIVRSWERWIENAGLPSKGHYAKDMMVTLAFHIPAPEDASSDESPNTPEKRAKDLGLRSIDVIIAAAELCKFVRAGEAIEDENVLAPPAQKRKRPSHGNGDIDNAKRRRPVGGREDEGWGWRRGGDAAQDAQPFTEALARYLDHHLALDMFHPAVRVSKIACGGFVLSEGRVKVFAPPVEEGAVAPPVWKLVALLAERAKGAPMEGGF